jgi:hypothetical protein
MRDAEEVLAFTCPRCGSVVFFDSASCVTCGAVLGFSSREVTFVEVDGAVPCANRAAIGCNWLAEADLCRSCALTRTRPADADAAGLAAWAGVESAKRYLVFQLDQLGLPYTGSPGLVFDLLSSTAGPVTTGHADGVVTIDLAEGADPHREGLRVGLAEPYRTVLGHLRHEVGHYYWLVLVDGSAALAEFRTLFGDERADYAEALRVHYDKPDDHSWTTSHVSRYAAAHPWEDWAETFAHYLHIRDSLQTAAAWRITVHGPTSAPVTVEPHRDGTDFDELTAAWLPLSTALNAMNRSMGKDDLYPFVLSTTVLAKLAFVHERITAGASKTDA